jgi:RNA polymerase sigma-70 factor (ECF subfamily)
MTVMTRAQSCDRDEQLVRQLAGGDGDALGELIARNERWVRGVIRASGVTVSAVDDVAQSVWVTLWQSADRMDDPARWRPWLYRLARHAAIDARRAGQRQRRLLSALADWLRTRTLPAGGPGGAASAGERQRALLSAVDRLPDRYRQVIVLRHLAGWSYRRMAEALDVPVATVETRLVRARRRLREMAEVRRDP